MQESILVVPRTILIPDEQQAWYGLKQVNEQDCIGLITANQQFLPRPAMEQDPKYKQIIPYMVYIVEDKVFVMQRRENASEARLAGKLTIGIGGHIRQEDMLNKSILAWAERELHEEVHLEGTYSTELLGMLNDDTNPVGEVHMGLVLLMRGTSTQISVKSELKSGTLMTISECLEKVEQFESWSQVILEQLSKVTAGKKLA